MVLFAIDATATNDNGGKDDDGDTDSATGIHANAIWFDLILFFVFFILAMLPLLNSVYSHATSHMSCTSGRCVWCFAMFKVFAFCLAFVDGATEVNLNFALVVFARGSLLFLFMNMDIMVCTRKRIESEVTARLFMNTRRNRVNLHV